MIGEAEMREYDEAKAAAQITEQEMKVLEVLGWGYGELCYSFAGIESRAKMPRGEVRDACRSLRAKGLAFYERGLWTEDGEPAGSGYGATKEGMALLRSRGRT